MNDNKLNNKTLNSLTLWKKTGETIYEKKIVLVYMAHLAKMKGG